MDQPCWSDVADHLVMELDTLESAWPPLSTSEVRDELNIMLHVMTIFSTRYPVISESVSKGISDLLNPVYSAGSQ